MYSLSYFKKQNWFKIVRRENSALLSSFLRLGPIQKNNELEFDSRMKHHLVLGGDAYAVIEEFEALKKRMVNLAMKDNGVIFRYLDKVDTDCENYIKDIKKIKHKYKRTEVSKYFELYQEASLKLATHLWPPLGFEDYLVQKIEETLSKHIDAQKDFNTFNAVFQILLSSTEETVIREKRKTILSLALKLKSKKISPNSTELKKVFLKYEYVDDHGINFNGPSLEQFMKQVKILSNKNPETELNDLRKSIKETSQKRNAVIKKYKLNKKIISLTEAAAKLPHTRLIRLEALIRGAYLLKNDLLADVSKKLGTKKISNFYCWEILHALEKNIKLKDKPQKHYFGVVDGFCKEFSKVEISELKNKIETKEKDVNEIKGSIACMGLVKGRVHVILSPEEFKDFKDNEILVTSMTVPDYVPLMKKSAAIITDEGGISCHAAIVSRELNKPCIIGTKIATKILKDGDLIEVDANKGIIKKI